MAGGKPLISIVIVNWDGLDDTRECLKYLKTQTYTNYEIIVVDNGSSDGSVAYLRRQKNIKLVENPKNLGFTGGHIAGYRASRGDYILLLNNDAIMAKDYLDIAVKTMLKDESIGAVGGRAYLWDNENKLFDTNNKFYSYQKINPVTAEAVFAQSDEGTEQEVNNVSGSCVLVRRTAVDRVGYLHKPFFAYYEESDLFARMKREGYKILYSPRLEIWHANAKTSAKKTPTFFYYMMMRNRFRFAVRNFEAWYLLLFLKYYLKMGLLAVIKSILPLEQRQINQAYAKAFFYNLFTGWKALAERIQLKRQLGSTNYSQIIIMEQNPFSLVINCDSLITLQKCIELSRVLRASCELIVVISKPELIKYASGLKSNENNLRFCINRGYFKTHPENLGAICATHDWLIINTAGQLDNEFISMVGNIGSYIPKLIRKRKKIACFSTAATSIKSAQEFLEITLASIVVVHRTNFIDAGGLDRELPVNDALRVLIAYGSLSKSLLTIVTPDILQRLKDYQVSRSPEKILADLDSKYNEVLAHTHQPSKIDLLAKRYYRLAQTRNLLRWVVARNIPARLKMGRLKNLVLFTLKLDRQSLATELKHIRNEVTGKRGYIDLASMKRYERQRLTQLTKHPEQTTIFIIIRDRLTHLKQLVKWLEEQKLRHIVLVDNDSSYPPLADYLQRTKYQVLEMHRNTGHTGIWSSGIIKILLPDDFYVVTDPDIIPTATGKAVLQHLYKVHVAFPHHLKVGLGLKIDDLPRHYALRDQVIKWESQFWKFEIGDNVFEAAVDTTFALYKPYTYYYFLHPSLRTGEPYTARHLPWYTDSRKLTPEDRHYRAKMRADINSWDAESLRDRYLNEDVFNSS